MQDQSKLRGYELSWSSRRSSMEGKAGGEGQTKTVSKEKLFRFGFSFPVIIALLVFGLAWLVYKIVV